MNRLPSEGRKEVPIATGVLDFFPNALAEVSKVSVAGAAQRGSEELVYIKEVARDQHADCLLRHLIDRGDFDNDGVRHSAKVAWRALALLQKEIDDEKEESLAR